VVDEAPRTGGGGLDPLLAGYVFAVRPRAPPTKHNGHHRLTIPVGAGKELPVAAYVPLAQECSPDRTGEPLEAHGNT